MEQLGVFCLLPPNRIKCGWLGRVFKTFYDLTVLWGWSPDPPKGPGRLGSPDVAELSDELYFGLCLGARARLGAHAPLACGRPWLIPSPPTVKKAVKTIKSYG